MNNADIFDEHWYKSSISSALQFVVCDDEFIKTKKQDAFLGSVNFGKALCRMFPDLREAVVR